MIERTLLEWERIGYGNTEDTIPEAQAARLAAVAEASPFAGRGGSGVLEYRRKDLRARGVVGVIATPGCQLEILPKIEASEDAHSADTATLRHRLVHMLAVARDIRIDAGTISRMDWQRDTLLEILIRLFCAKLMDAVRQGMPRRYVEIEDDLAALRGRLNVTRQFTTLAAQPQKLACQFDDFSIDTLLNQVMKAAVSKLSRVAQASDNQRALRELTFTYADINDIRPAAVSWDAIVLDRTNERWRELLSLARLLLGDQHQNTSAGGVEGHTLLFEMNVLFEEYVARLLKQALAGTGLWVSSQGGHRSCLFDGDVGRFRTRPDLIVRSGEDVVLIIDTKWKRIAARIDDPKQGVSQSDVYQMMAYGQLYDCAHTILLYPYHHGLTSADKSWDYSIGARDSDRWLSVSAVDVSQNRATIKQNLRNLIDGRLGDVMTAPDHKSQPLFPMPTS